MKVLTQYAAGAQSAAVMACFQAAALAVEVDVDVGAIGADWFAVGDWRAGQEPGLPAVRAGPRMRGMIHLMQYADFY